jgi:ABC-2 type transport system permease protein
MSTADNPKEKERGSASLGKHLQLFGAYLRFNLAAAMEYRGSFLLQVFGMIVNNAAFIIFWAALFSKVPRIGNYGFREVMFLWALVSASFGLAHICFGNIGQVSRMILQGELDTYLLQPKDVCLNLIASRSIVSAWGDLAYGILLFVTVFGFEPLRLGLFFAFTVGSGLLMGSVIFSAQVLTFFVGNSSAISRLVTEFVISFTLYPECIYRGPVRWVLYSLIPAGFIVFVPLRIMQAFSWPALGLLVGVDLAYVCLSYWLFRIGLRRYESGNLIGTRM